MYDRNVKISPVFPDLTLVVENTISMFQEKCLVFVQKLLKLFLMAKNIIMAESNLKSIAWITQIVNY